MLNGYCFFSLVTLPIALVLLLSILSDLSFSFWTYSHVHIVEYIHPGGSLINLILSLSSAHFYSFNDFSFKFIRSMFIIYPRLFSFVIISCLFSFWMQCILLLNGKWRRGPLNHDAPSPHFFLKRTHLYLSAFRSIDLKDCSCSVQRNFLAVEFVVSILL